MQGVLPSSGLEVDLLVDGYDNADSIAPDDDPVDSIAPDDEHGDSIALDDEHVVISPAVSWLRRVGEESRRRGNVAISVSVDTQSLTGLRPQHTHHHEQPPRPVTSVRRGQGRPRQSAGRGGEDPR